MEFQKRIQKRYSAMGVNQTIIEIFKRWTQKISNDLKNATSQDIADVVCSVFLELDSQGHKFPMSTEDMIEGFMRQAAVKFEWSDDFVDEVILLCWEKL